MSLSIISSFTIPEAVLDERLKVIEIIQITQISNPFSIFNCVVESLP